MMVSVKPRLHEALGLDTCIRCTLCADSCPTYVNSGDPLVAPASRLRMLKDLMKGSEVGEDACREVFRCTVCGRCMVACPFSIPAF
ncbi:MAG: hypothetical protein DRJ69_07055, partial [Thermoprotei archaeon]